MDVTAYLDRIDYHGPLDPTGATLRALHQAHLLAVPFENLNIGLGWPIVLDPAALFDKIVVRRRGGFCYELNGLFAALLRELGFDVTMFSAGVARTGGGFGPEFDHLTLLVQSPWSVVRGQLHQAPDHGLRTTDHEQQSPWSVVRGQLHQAPDHGLRTTDHEQGTIWLADVGFGDSFREPLDFDEPDEQRQGDRAYRIMAVGEQRILEQREGEGAWEPQYRFTPRPRRYDQFRGMCRYHQTSPESSFTRRRICTRATPEGRVTLSDMRLIITSGDERRERLLADEAEVQAALRDYFGIDLGAALSSAP